MQESQADNKLALTRVNGAPSPQPDASPFLNKLYQMVDDPSTDHLIKWSDDGESFVGTLASDLEGEPNIWRLTLALHLPPPLLWLVLALMAVLNPDELSKEVLGNWFKHKKFTSFVRQLNMYGFHKMQQLTSGSLSNSTEPEISQFQAPNFRRGHPELLKYIVRKKNAPSRSGNELSAIELLPDTQEVEQSSQLAHALHSIVGDVSTLKRDQTNLVSTIKALQSSNNQLWKDSLASQEVQKKQQDTLDRIVKFLAGVFGNNAAGRPAREAESDASRHTSDRPQGPPRKGSVLMIEDSRKGRNQDAPTPSGSKNTYDTDRFMEADPSVDGNSDHDQDMSSPYVEEVNSRAGSTVRSPSPSTSVPLKQTQSLIRRSPTKGRSFALEGVEPNSDGSQQQSGLNDYALNATLAQLLGQGNDSSPGRFYSSPADPQLDRSSGSPHVNQQSWSDPGPSYQPQFPSSTNDPLGGANYPSNTQDGWSYDPFQQQSGSGSGSNSLAPMDRSQTVAYPYGVSQNLLNNTHNTDETLQQATELDQGINDAQSSLETLMRNLFRSNPHALDDILNGQNQGPSNGIGSISDPTTGFVGNSGAEPVDIEALMRDFDNEPNMARFNQQLHGGDTPYQDPNGLSFGDSDGHTSGRSSARSSSSPMDIKPSVAPLNEGEVFVSEEPDQLAKKPRTAARKRQRA